MEFAMCNVWQTQVCVLGTASRGTMTGSHFESRQTRIQRDRQTDRYDYVNSWLGVDDILTCVVVGQSISVNFFEEKKGYF